MAATSDNSVAVVMPCYNGMPFLREALDSAIAQTHRPAAVIVVDDGSKDESAGCVREYAGRFPEAKLRLIQQANAGEPAARNTGIKAAVELGVAWVANLDTDDWWEADKLEKQLQAADDPVKGGGAECVLVHTGVMKHFPDGRSEPADMEAAARRSGWCTQALLEPAGMGHPSIMVRISALEKIGGYDASFRQACDIDLYFRLSAIGTFAFVPERLLHYRYHEGQMSQAKYEQMMYHFRAIEKFFAAHPEHEERIGRDRIQAAMAELTAVKLESYYWRRRMDDFRRLLVYAGEHGLDNARIRQWRKKARWPDWLIRLKDCRDGPKSKVQSPKLS